MIVRRLTGMISALHIFGGSMYKGYEVYVAHENRMDFDRHYSEWIRSNVEHGVTIITSETPEGFTYYPLPKQFLEYMDKNHFPYRNKGYREMP